MKIRIITKIAMIIIAMIVITMQTIRPAKSYTRRGLPNRPKIRLSVAKSGTAYRVRYDLLELPDFSGITVVILKSVHAFRSSDSDERAAL